MAERRVGEIRRQCGLSHTLTPYCAFIRTKGSLRNSVGESQIWGTTPGIPKDPNKGLISLTMSHKRTPKIRTNLNKWDIVKLVTIGIIINWTSVIGKWSCIGDTIDQSFLIRMVFDMGENR